MPNKELTQKAASEWQPDYDLDEYLEDWDVDDKLYDRVCDDRHCVAFGDKRRDAWRREMFSWSLDCDYFHTVFTLPHEFNPLIYVNSPRRLETS